MDSETSDILEKARVNYSLSFRSINKILKVARTIADINENENPVTNQASEKNSSAKGDSLYEEDDDDSSDRIIEIDNSKENSDIEVGLKVQEAEEESRFGDETRKENILLEELMVVLIH